MRWHRLDTLNLVLAALLGLLLVLLFAPEAEPPSLMGVDPHSVNELRISRDGKVQLALLRDGEGWMLTHPEIQRADNKRVAQLLALLKTPGLRAATVSAKDAGLQPPRLTFDADSTRLLIGSPSSPAGQRYVSFQSQTYLIDEHWYRLLTLPASFYQAK